MLVGDEAAELQHIAGLSHCFRQIEQLSIRILAHEARCDEISDLHLRELVSRDIRNDRVNLLVAQPLAEQTALDCPHGLRLLLEADLSDRTVRNAHPRPDVLVEPDLPRLHALTARIRINDKRLTVHGQLQLIAGVDAVMPRLLLVQERNL